ncbi:DNA polymerase alpha subunit B [Araneus ventricosus]|uniref:DNA polymerase alpha subunit B n=1 Tax=Araneus ventricosus TaxID=182803 RepID=A0A4Y2GEL6_ARAVE|nr:DNA polymerase alpha subunit B [Araneus ventricosus]
MDPACQVGTVQGHGGSIMVWGVFSWQFWGSLVLVPTFLNGIRNVELLGDHLHLFMFFCHPHGNGVFQQGNCTSHRSWLATVWLDEHSSDFPVMNWPPRSPELNPIEHLWDVLEKGLKAYRTTPATLTELWIALAYVWQAIPVERFRKLVESIPRRMAAVIKIIAGTGINNLGKKLVLKTLYENSFPDYHLKVPGLENCLDSLGVVVAAGPFATADTMSYEPLWDLMKYVKTHMPHVVILIGPFVDVKNDFIENGDLNETYDDIFKRLVLEILKNIESLSTKVVLVPSTRDAHHDFVYPTPPYSVDHATKRLYLASDPCILNIEGVIFAITSTDILFHLGKEEISYPQQPDRFGRLCKHLLTQKHFYPLYPPNEEINVDFPRYELHAPLPVMPHVLIVPSDFRYFIKDINGCCCINPERLTKHSSGGTFARLNITRMDANKYKGSITDCIQAQVLKI